MTFPHILDNRVFLASIGLSMALLVAAVSVSLTLCKPNVKPAADWDSHIVASTRSRQDVYRLCANDCGLVFVPELVTCHNPDETLPVISRIGSLHYVQFFGERVGDNASLLANLPRLEGLSFRQCQISQGALWSLADIESLRYLTIASSRLCDQDLNQILTTARLIRLNVSYNPEITERGMEPYQHAAMLTEIDLNNTGVRHLAFVRHMSGLTHLFLSSTQIRDSDLDDLSGLQQLEELDVSATLISDEGIQSITRVTTLRRVNMCYTKATPSGIRWLRHTLPNAAVYYDETIVH